MCGCTTHRLFIHSPFIGRLGCFLFLAVTNNALELLSFPLNVEFSCCADDGKSSFFIRKYWSLLEMLPRVGLPIKTICIYIFIVFPHFIEMQMKNKLYLLKIYNWVSFDMCETCETITIVSIVSQPRSKQFLELQMWLVRLRG